MNWRSVHVISVFAFCLLLVACSGGHKNNRGSSTVTISVSSGGAQAAPGVRKAAPVVTTLRFTISAPDMSSITKEDAFTLTTGVSTTVEESFDVPNGFARVFLVEALDASGDPAYAGTGTADLDGTDVDLAVAMKKQFFVGTQMLGTAAKEEANALARDSSGNLIVAGITYGDLDGNLNSDPTHTSPDVFVAKYDLSGAKLWAREFGTGIFRGTGFDIANGVAVDASGNIFVVGQTTGNLNGQSNFDTTLVTADAFVVKLDPDGNILWTRLIGSAGQDLAEAVATDSSGNVYLSGYTDGGLGAFVNKGGQDIFVAKFDASGTLQWLDQRGTSGDDLAEGIAVDGSGNVFVTGFTDGGLDGNTNTNDAQQQNTADVFLVKYTSTGSWQWTSQFGTADVDEAWAVAADSSGNVYITGDTYGTLAGMNPDPTGSTADMFVAKFDTNGSRTWIRQLGSSGIDSGMAVAVDANGFVDVTGYTNGSLDGNTNAGGYDVFAVKYDTSGNKQWTQQIGTATDDAGYGLAVNTKGNLFIAGTTDGNFDGIVNAGSSDAFLMSYDKNGGKQ